VLAARRRFNAVNKWLPDERWKSYREYLVGIKGAHYAIGGGIDR